MSERKKYTYIVEVLYEKVVTKEVDGQMTRELVLNVYNEHSTDDIKDRALNRARRSFKKVLKEGLELNGGAVLTSIITPACIRQVGLIDLDQYEEDLKAQAEETQEVDELPIDDPA